MKKLILSLIYSLFFLVKQVPSLKKLMTYYRNRYGIIKSQLEKQMSDGNPNPTSTWNLYPYLEFLDDQIARKDSIQPRKSNISLEKKRKRRMSSYHPRRDTESSLSDQILATSLHLNTIKSESQVNDVVFIDDDDDDDHQPDHKS